MYFGTTKTHRQSIWHSTFFHWNSPHLVRPTVQWYPHTHSKLLDHWKCTVGSVSGKISGPTEGFCRCHCHFSPKLHCCSLSEKSLKIFYDWYLIKISKNLFKIDQMSLLLGRLPGIHHVAKWQFLAWVTEIYPWNCYSRSSELTIGPAEPSAKVTCLENANRVAVSHSHRFPSEFQYIIPALLGASLIENSTLL